MKTEFLDTYINEMYRGHKKMCLPSSEVNKDPVLYLHWMSNCLLSLINESSKKESCQTEPGVGRDFSGGILGGLSTRREGPSPLFTALFQSWHIVGARGIL